MVSAFPCAISEAANLPSAISRRSVPPAQYRVSPCSPQCKENPFFTPATQAAQAATQTIPIVMVSVGDPLRAGLVASLAHPGGNVTGNSALGPDAAPKRLQLLKEVIPSLVRVALLFNPDNAANIIYRDEIETAARDPGVSLIQVEASTVPDLDTNLRGMLSQHPDALIATADFPPLTDAQDHRLSRKQPNSRYVYNSRIRTRGRFDVLWRKLARSLSA